MVLPSSYYHVVCRVTYYHANRSRHRAYFPGCPPPGVSSAEPRSPRGSQQRECPQFPSQCCLVTQRQRLDLRRWAQQRECGAGQHVFRRLVKLSQCDECGLKRDIHAMLAEARLRKISKQNYLREGRLQYIRVVVRITVITAVRVTGSGEEERRCVGKASK